MQLKFFEKSPRAGCAPVPLSRRCSRLADFLVDIEGLRIFLKKRA
jgi:hypothetical protein